jgi:uncharacterized protein
VINGSICPLYMPADGGPEYIIESKHTMLLELRVAKEDVGKVIGKQGRTAQAIRTLIGAVSSKLKIRTILEIIDQ